MPTLLTTRRMAPELAARVLASVRGKRSAGPEGRARVFTRARVVALTRLIAAVSLFAVAIVVTLRERRKISDFEQARSSVLAAARAASAPLLEGDLAAAERIESWLHRSAVAYEGDVVVEALRAPGGLEAALGAGSVYVRGTSEQLGTSAGTVEAASASVKDPFLTCLLAPPGARSEKALLERVHRSYAGDVDSRAAAVRRLREVELGLPFLTPSWAAKVEAAADWDELNALRRAFEKAPVESARAGLKASLLIFAIDEPGDGAGPTELDGERAHPVRVGLVDLSSGAVLLRLRKQVDPSGFSPEKRPLYASGLDSCALAYDVRASVTKTL